MDPLTTERLILRDFVGMDWVAVYEIFSDPDVAQYTYLMDSARVRKWVAGKLKNQCRTPRVAQGKAIVLQEQDQLIGWIEMSPPQFIGRPSVPGEMALSYALHRSFSGHGYMTEAVRQMMNFAFENLQVPQLVATCEVVNAPVGARSGKSRHGSRRNLHAFGTRLYGDSLLPL